MKKIIITIIIACLSGIYTNIQAQGNNTAEDSLQLNSDSFLHGTTIGGYGNALYTRDMNLKVSTATLERFVLFVGHKFNSKISIFSELEVENAKIEGGEEGGELALEQCYLKFNFDPDHYLVAGLFLPRLGILNENHLPNTFNGNERTIVETLILPSTWRELGLSFYGNARSNYLSYSVGLMNGLNSAAFEHGTGIREGRFEGSNASANNLALTGSLQYYKNNLKAQVSGYYGGSVGLAPRQSDSLQLESGVFGTPVMLAEADVVYEVNGWTLKLLGTLISIPDASDINRAYANNTPEAEYGVYAELAYNVFEKCTKQKTQQLIAFVRYEKLDVNSKIPENGIPDGTLDQQHIIAGFNYLPIKNVAIKADARFIHTGEQNPALILNPNPASPDYNVDNTFLNLGLGFAF